MGQAPRPELPSRWFEEGAPAPAGELQSHHTVTVSTFMRASPVLATHIPQRASEAAWPVLPLHRQGGALLWGSFPPLKPLSRKFYGTPQWLKMERHPALSGLGDFGYFQAIPGSCMVARGRPPRCLSGCHSRMPRPGLAAPSGRSHTSGSRLVTSSNG